MDYLLREEVWVGGGGWWVGGGKGLIETGRDLQDLYLHKNELLFLQMRLLHLQIYFSYEHDNKYKRQIPKFVSIDPLASSG